MRELLALYGYGQQDMLTYLEFHKNYEEESLETLGIEKETK